MTEQEAKTKWCPMAYTNRGEEMRPPESVRCITSECMMWRWNVRGAWVNGVYDDNYPVEGYCGLGGEP